MSRVDIKKDTQKSSKQDSIVILGDTIYKPALSIEIAKWAMLGVAVAILIYLLATRYAGPITLVIFAVMALLAGGAFILFTKYQAKLVTTNVSVETTEKTFSDKQIKFVFYETKETKEKEVCVDNIRDIIIITHLKYMKLIDKDNKEVFELSIEHYDDLMNLSQFIIKHTGAYLISM